LAGVGNDGSVAAYGGLEPALGGAIGGGAQGGAAGVLKKLGKETGEANLGGAGSSPASSGKEKKDASAGREAYNANEGNGRLPRRLATQAGKQTACLHVRTWRCARGGRAGQGAVIHIG